MLDSSIAIHARDGEERVLARLAEHSGQTCLSALGLVELQRGNHIKPELSALRAMRLSVLLKYLPVLAFDQAAAEAYGQIIAVVGWVRSRDYDRMIAAHAIAADCTLVTANVEDFRDIPGLRLENWAE